MPTIEVVTPEPALLGESPIWSIAEGVLYWIDIDGRAIHRHDPGVGNERRDTPGRPGSIALTTVPGVLLLASEHQVGWFDWASGTFAPVLDLEEPGVGIRLNDGRTDPAGRFVVGSMYEDTGAAKFVGSLHVVEADGTASALRRAVGVTNGLGFDPDRGLMYWADTPTQQVLAWDYDATTGSRTNERVFFDYLTVDGKPDGACVDADGYYWSASVHGWAVIRVAPDGTVERRIDVPVEMPTMPCFGGPDLDILYVTSIATDDEDADRSGGVRSGSLLRIDLAGQNIRGRVDTPFAGTPPTTIG